MFCHRCLVTIVIATIALVLVGADAHARAGGGFSGGSRGGRTFSAPAPTPTAPTAAPIQRSMTQPSDTAAVGQTARPGLFGGGLFGGGLFGGLAAGFLGAGLFGLLFGQGLFGGMTGFASIIGLLLQIVLVVIVARLIFAWWQRRRNPGSGICWDGSGNGAQFWWFRWRGPSITRRRSSHRRQVGLRCIRAIARGHPSRLFSGRSFDAANDGDTRDAVLFFGAAGGEREPRSD